MQVDPEEFRRRFDGLSDDALLEVNPDELVDVAQDLYYAELERRGLIEESEESEEPEAEPTPGTPEQGELVLAAEFGSSQEAAFGRSLLKSANIPVFSHSDFSGILGATEEEAKIYVPSSYLEEAKELLATPLSDEDLAAQAEAAGEADDDASEDEIEGPVEDKESDGDTTV